MSDKLITSAVSITLAIVGVAIIALLVSKQSNTTSLFGAIGGGFSDSLRCALSPILGGGNCGTTTSSAIKF